MPEIKKILIVDDDDIFLNIAKYAFAHSVPSAKVDFVKNGEEAISYLKLQQPDLLLVDLNLPVMNGWQLVDQIYQVIITPSFKIYIITSSVDPRDRSKAEGSKTISGFIEKPITSEKIERDLVT